MGGAGRLCRRGGNPPAPAFPLGETGKGDESSQRMLFCPAAISPGFHPHSKVSLLALVLIGVLDWELGAAISVSN